MSYYGFNDLKNAVIHKDIKDKNIINTISKVIKNKKIDIILGGPPCQSFSSLGRAKDKNSMKNDPRNYLFENYEKILNYFTPSIFLFENVTGLLTAKFKNKKVVDVIKSKLGKKYNILSNVNEMVLNSCEYGVPQIRRRVFLIGVRNDISYKVEKILKI